MDSRIQTEKECYFCGRRDQLHSHHIFGGNPGRKNSEKYGLKVWLCMEHHTGDTGVHKNPRGQLNWNLKRLGQQTFERECGDRNKFMEIFGKNYLED